MAMPDIFTQTKCSEVILRIHLHENKTTNLRLFAIFLEAGITRKQLKVGGFRKSYLIFGDAKVNFLF